MIKDFGSKKPSRKDWASYTCRLNYAKRITAEKIFKRPFRLRKIVWDKEGGYPEHSWGYIQWSVRPVWPGFGCDGTADSEHHARAYYILKALGFDADVLYRKAYKKESSFYLPSISFNKLEIGIDYIIPSGTPGPKDIQDMLFDLYQLNNRSYVEVIEEALKRKGISYPDFSQPSFEFPDYPVPSSGERVRVRIRKESDFELIYFISNGDIILPLFQQSKFGSQLHIEPVWWKDLIVRNELERLPSNKARCQYLEKLITEGEIPEKVKDCVNTI